MELTRLVQCLVALLHALALLYVLKGHLVQVVLRLLLAVVCGFILAAAKLLFDNTRFALTHRLSESGKFKAPGSLPLSKLVTIHRQKDTKYKQMLNKSRFLKCNSFIQYNNQRILEAESTQSKRAYNYWDRSKKSCERVKTASSASLNSSLIRPRRPPIQTEGSVDAQRDRYSTLSFNDSLPLSPAMGKRPLSSCSQCDRKSVVSKLTVTFTNLNNQRPESFA